jgi:ATP-binding cassette subfamily G (WHITE) protein 2 (PDR)
VSLYQDELTTSGCSTLLKTIAGETHGIYLDKDSHMNYRGE